MVDNIEEILTGLTYVLSCIAADDEPIDSLSEGMCPKEIHCIDQPYSFEDGDVPLGEGLDEREGIVSKLRRVAHGHQRHHKRVCVGWARIYFHLCSNRTELQFSKGAFLLR